MVPPRAAERPLGPGARVGPFAVVRWLGGGRWEARDTTLGRAVALRHLPPERQGEAQALARLSHPNVVPVFQVVEADGELLVATALASGQPLAEWVAHKPRRLDELLDAFAQAGRGLSALRGAGVAEGPFQDEQLLVGADGRVVADLDAPAASALALQQALLRAMHDQGLWPPRWMQAALREGEADGDPAALVDAIERSRARFRRRQRVLGGAALVALGVALALLGLWLRSSGALAPAPRARRSVAVLGPHLASAPAEAAWLPSALAEMLGAELGSDGGLRVVPPDTVAHAALDLGLGGAAASSASILRLRQHLAADAMVTAEIAASGTPLQLELSVSLWDAATGQTLAALVERGGEDHLLDLVARLGHRLRDALGAAAREPSRTAQASFPTQLEAARLYALGREQLRAFEAFAATQTLQQAARLEPDNPRIQTALAEALGGLGLQEKAREAAARAYEARDRLGREEGLRVEILYWHTQRDFAKAVELANALFTFFPDDLELGLLLASEQYWADRMKDALQTLERLRKLPRPAGDDPRIDAQESEASERMGDLQRAVRAAQRAHQKAVARGARRMEAQSLLAEAWAQRNLGEVQRAFALWQQAERLYAALHANSQVAHARMMQATVLADRGDLEAARERFEAAIAAHRADGNPRGQASALHNLSILLRWARDLPAALERSAQAQQLMREMNDRPGEATALALEAHVRQDLGELQRAQQLYEQSLVTRRELHARQVPSSQALLGEVLMLQGRLDEARALFTQAATAQDAIVRHDAHRLLARLALSQGKAKEAAALAAEAARGLVAAGKRDEAALAETTLSAALLAQGQRAEAWAAVERAQASLQKSHSGVARGAVAAAAARAAPPEQRAAALQRLSQVRAEAERAGAIEDLLEARLAAAEVAPPQSRSEARRELSSIAAQARAHGFALLADRAERAAR